MYAVVKTGGKQYRVSPGEKLKVEQITADVGAEVVLDQVLMVGEGDSVRLGQPVVAGATVKATVVEPRARRQGHDFQDAPAQALPEASGPSPELHRTQDRQHRRLTERNHHGTQKSRRQFAQRPRLGIEAPRRQVVRRRADQRRQHHHPPARHAVPSRASTSGWARTTRCSRWSTARSCSRPRARKRRSS